MLKQIVLADLEQALQARPGGDPAGRVADEKLDRPAPAGAEVQPLRQHRHVQDDVPPAPARADADVAEDRLVEGAQFGLGGNGDGGRPRRPVPPPGILGLADEDARRLAALGAPPPGLGGQTSAQRPGLLGGEALRPLRQPDQQHVLAGDQELLHAGEERAEGRRVVAQVGAVEEDRGVGVECVQGQLDGLGLADGRGDSEPLPQPPGAILDPAAIEAVEGFQGLLDSPGGDEPLADVAGDGRGDPPVGQGGDACVIGGRTGDRLVAQLPRPGE